MEISEDEVVHAAPLQLFQRNLHSGRFDAVEQLRMRLAPASSELLSSISSCQSYYVAALKAARQQRRHRRGGAGGGGDGGEAWENVVCLSLAACREDTLDWLDCVSGRMNGRSAEAAGERLEGIPDSCVAARVRVERCAEEKASLLLATALTGEFSEAGEL